MSKLIAVGVSGHISRKVGVRTLVNYERVINYDTERKIFRVVGNLPRKIVEIEEEFLHISHLTCHMSDGSTIDRHIAGDGKEILKEKLSEYIKNLSNMCATENTETKKTVFPSANEKVRISNVHMLKETGFVLVPVETIIFYNNGMVQIFVKGPENRNENKPVYPQINMLWNFITEIQTKTLLQRFDFTIRDQNIVAQRLRYLFLGEEKKESKEEPKKEENIASDDYWDDGWYGGYYGRYCNAYSRGAYNYKQKKKSLFYLEGSPVDYEKEKANEANSQAN